MAQVITEACPRSEPIATPWSSTRSTMSDPRRASRLRVLDEVWIQPRGAERGASSAGSHLVRSTASRTSVQFKAPWHAMWAIQPLRACCSVTSRTFRMTKCVQWLRMRSRSTSKILQCARHWSGQRAMPRSRSGTRRAGRSKWFLTDDRVGLRQNDNAGRSVPDGAARRNIDWDSARFFNRKRST